jgi:peptidyl-tRNA hydrolase, PTH1 family
LINVTKVVVGLGNPGPQYHNTPHNLGFSVVDLLASEVGLSVETEQCHALTVQRTLGDDLALLAKPQTYMNLSGQSVSLLLEEHDLSPDKLIVICDDLALPYGKIRIRRQGSSGGHKGLESIIGWLETTEFVRVRLGVGPGIEISDVADYVLRPIPTEFGQLTGQMSLQATEAVKLACAEGFQAAMNKFN